MGEPSLERVADEIMPLTAGKGLDQDLVGAGHDRQLGLQPEPIRHVVWQPRPIVRIGQQPAHPFGEIG